MEKLILKRIPGSEPLLRQLSFARKLGLLKTMGIADKDTVKGLHYINSLRNRFAHELDSGSLVQSDADILRKYLAHNMRGVGAIVVTPDFPNDEDLPALEAKHAMVGYYMHLVFLHAQR